LGVLCPQTSLIAKLKLSKKQIKAIQGKELQTKKMHANAPTRLQKKDGKEKKGEEVELLIKTLDNKIFKFKC